jgi:hypothetical protein
VLQELLLAWQEETRKIRPPSLAYQEACALPTDDPQKDVKVEAASKAVKRAHEAVAHAKAFYESQKDLYNTMLAQATPAPPERSGSPAMPGLEPWNQSTYANLNTMKAQALQSELVRGVPNMFSNGLHMNITDNRQIWVYVMKQYHQTHPAISVEVITQAVLQSQISRDFQGDEAPTPEAMKDFGLFMDHLLSRQSVKARWENHQALEQLWMGIHQVVGSKHRGASQDYAEKFRDFIRRVKRLAEILYPPNTVESHRRDAAVVRAVIQGLDVKWRDSFYIAATRVYPGFPETKRLNLTELERLANTVDMNREAPGAPTVTFELLPSARYRAEVGGGNGGQFYVPIFPVPRNEYDRGHDPKRDGGQRGGSSNGGQRGGSSSSSSHTSSVPPPPPSNQQNKNTGTGRPKDDRSWEEKKKDFCTFCARKTPPLKHIKGECPTLDPKTGKIISEAKKPRK